MNAYVAVSPKGAAIPSTIRPTADDAWAALRASITDPDTLIEKGWHVHRVVGIIAERVT